MGELYLISGDDDFARKRRAKALVLELSGLAPDAEVEENPALEIVSGDADTLKPAEIAIRFLEALRTPPFLSDQKLLWLRHYPDFELFGGESDVFEAVANTLGAPLPADVTVVIDAPHLDQRRQWVRKLKNSGAKIEICGTSGKNSDRNWAESRRLLVGDFCRREGRRIEPDALQFLAEVIGGDTGTLTNELKKLLCYVGNAPVITLEHCQSIVSFSAETLAWEYTAAVVSGDARSALKHLARLLSDDGDTIRMLMSLAGEFQRMIATYLALEELGISRVNSRTFDMLPAEVRERAPENFLLKLHPYRAFKVCEAALARRPEELAAKLVKIRDTAKALVSGGGDSRLLLEQLTLELARK